MEEDSKGTELSNVIRIDDDRVRVHLGRIDQVCNVGRNERTQARRDQRPGSYDRKLQIKAGEIRLKVPKLRKQTFETAIVEHFRRRETRAPS
jgi:putative transposase